MKVKTEKTIKPTIAARKPWGRLNEETKAKIISEISSGHIFRYKVEKPRPIDPLSSKIDHA